MTAAMYKIRNDVSSELKPFQDYVLTNGTKFVVGTNKAL